MKNIKKILLVLFLFFFIGITNVKAEEKVKVYVFEAGGCPYCEKQIEYLESLPDYNKKFVVIEKELYVDHIDWEFGKDYALGVKVATAFKDAGFEGATYQGTPFVVVSDIYAEAAYNQNLEEVIVEAYEKGDKDVVGCLDRNEKKCLEVKKEEPKQDETDYVPDGNKTDTEPEKREHTNTLFIIVLLGSLLGISFIINIFFVARYSKQDIKIKRR